MSDIVRSWVFKFLSIAAAMAATAALLFVFLGQRDYAALFEAFESDVSRAEKARLHALWLRQTAVLPPQQIASIVGPLAKKCPGAVVVGVIDRNKQLILGWGKDASGRDAGGDTEFETASVSKAFAGLMLAQMVCDGSVQLEQPVEELADSRVPCCSGSKITLRQLATHSSGLPPWPDNRGSTESSYSHHDLVSYLNSAAVLSAPDTEIMYSNTGFALLGDVLAAQEHMTFNELLQKRICKPLGMTNTQVGLREDQRKRLAIGHWADGRAAHPSAPTAGGGADGIRSTVRDLLKLAAAYIGVIPTNFQNAMELSTQPYIDFSEELDSGLGWFIYRKDGMVEKSGKIAGYRSHISFDPYSKTAVVILAASEAFPSPQLGSQILHKMAERRALIESGLILEPNI